MKKKLVLNSIADMTLANAARVAFDAIEIELGSAAEAIIVQGRSRFDHYMSSRGGYVYGSTTAPGSRAKVVLSHDDSARQGETLRRFIPLQAGPGEVTLPERCVRLAILARLSNALTGAGKLQLATVQAITDLLNAPPAVPLHAAACSGEVIPLTWLMAPLADLPLEIGEAMALINGSPFCSAMACDVALTTQRRLRLAAIILGLSIEAAGCPSAHFDVRLADFWHDPFYKQSLDEIDNLMRGSKRQQLNHQAPTSWRVIPNVLASASQARKQAAEYAEIVLQSLKDNPTFIRRPTDSEQDIVVSSSGFHDHRAAKVIDQINNAMVDLCVLASRQVAHLLDGGSLGLPPLLARPGDGVGMEYLAWGLTEPLASARQAAEPTTLAVSLHDPVGNQSDIASLGFMAYGKHLTVMRGFDTCFATLAATATMALQFREAHLPIALRPVHKLIASEIGSSARSVDAVGAPLRRIRTLLSAIADEMTTTDAATLMYE